MNQITNKEENLRKAASEIIAEGFKVAGISDGEDFKGLKKLLNARKLTVDKFGEEHWEDDTTAISRGVELSFRLKRLLDNKMELAQNVAVTHKLNEEDVGRLEKIAAELRSLESRLATDKSQYGKIIDI